MSRALTEFEQEVIDELWRRKCATVDLAVGGSGTPQPTHAYVTVASPLVVDGQTVLPGTVLKIVMISRFGDVGLTPNLKADHGYGIRLPPEDESISDIRWTPEPSDSALKMVLEKAGGEKP